MSLRLPGRAGASSIVDDALLVEVWRLYAQCGLCLSLAPGRLTSPSGLPRRPPPPAFSAMWRSAPAASGHRLPPAPHTLLQPCSASRGVPRCASRSEETAGSQRRASSVAQRTRRGRNEISTGQAEITSAPVSCAACPAMRPGLRPPARKAGSGMRKWWWLKRQFHGPAAQSGPARPWHKA